MKVLHVINSMSTGGAERLVSEMLPLLKKAEVDVELLVLQKNHSIFIDKIIDAGIKVHYANHGLYSPRMIFTMRFFLNRYDIIHVHLFPAQYWVAIAKLLFFGRQCLVTTEHSTHNRRRESNLWRPIERRIYKQYQRVVAISESVQHNLAHWLQMRDNGRFCVVVNGVDLDVYNKASGYTKTALVNSENAQLILMVGRFDAAKDQATVVQALTLLPDTVHLLFVGDGLLREGVETLVAHLNLSNRVHFFGIRKDVPALIKSADICVISSHWEGLGLVSVEYMAARKPVIASDVPGLGDIVRGAGELFSPGNYHMLAEIVSKMLVDNVYKEEVAVKCYKRSEMYGINKMIEQYISLYKQVMHE